MIAEPSGVVGQPPRSDECHFPEPSATRPPKNPGAISDVDQWWAGWVAAP